MEQLKNKHIGETVWIIGKGPSLEYLKKTHIGSGIIIALNQTIKKIEELDFKNETYCMFKDGGNKRHYREDNLTPECDFRGQCSEEFCGFVLSKKATLLVHELESKYCHEDYTPRYVLDLGTLELQENTFSLLMAVKTAEYMGCTSFNFVSCDAHAVGDMQNTFLYKLQADTFKKHIEHLKHKFITPREVEMTKINLGSGNRSQKGYINIDIQERVNPDLVCDISKGLPYEDNSIDEVRAFDFLEHLHQDEVIDVVTEMWRVLKPGGKFESFTPDAEFGQGAFQDFTHRSFWTENSWLYFSDDCYRDLYGTKANFNIEKVERISGEGRVYHLYVIATKREPGK